MGLFNKLTKKYVEKKENEALTILMEGTAPFQTLENALDSLRHFCFETGRGRYAIGSLYECLGKLCGLKRNESDITAIDLVFIFVIISLESLDTFSEEIEEGMKLLSEIYRRHPDFNREVNEFALNAQPDYKKYSGILPYLSLAYLYGWGYEPNVQEAEEYADKAEALEKNIITENLRTRIEAVENGQ